MALLLGFGRMEQGSESFFKINYFLSESSLGATDLSNGEFGGSMEACGGLVWLQCYKPPLCLLPLGRVSVCLL